jgi:nitrogen fixation/metabolism regulation signal transduction histidine kinase
VSLRTRFILYLVAVHLLMAAVAAAVVAEHRWWLVAAELVLVASFLTGLHLLRRFASTLSFVDESAQLLEDGDVTSRMRELGHPQVDRLVRVYNRMVDSLRAERVHLQEQHHFLALVLRESPGGILVFDFDGRIVMANPAAERVLQAAPGALAGRRLDELDARLAQDIAALAPGERRVCPVWGGRRVRVWHGTFSDRGFRRGFVLIEELTEELRQSEKAAYEQLIRMLSHEVNNTVGASNSLLHSCLSYAGQLRAEDAADFTHALGVVIARTEQLNRFMRGFADVVRLPAPRLAPAEPGAILDRLIELLRPEAARRGIAIRREGEPAAGPVAMDAAQLEQALLNVMKNGLEASRDGGCLTVRLLRRDGEPVIEIEDAGPGLPDAVRAHLFTPFFSTKEGGQGIGLTVVQEVLANHRFPFALEAPPGGPATFTVVLAAPAPAVA